MSVCFGVIVRTRIKERCVCVSSGVLVRSAPCDPGVCVLSPLCRSASCTGFSDGALPRRLCGQNPLQRCIPPTRAAMSGITAASAAGILQHARPLKKATASPPPQHGQPEHRQPFQITQVTQASRHSQSHQSRTTTATAAVSAAASSPSPLRCHRCRPQHPLHPSHGADHRRSGLHHPPPTLERRATASADVVGATLRQPMSAREIFPDTADAATCPPSQSVQPTSTAEVAGIRVLRDAPPRRLPPPNRLRRPRPLHPPVLRTTL